MPLYEDGLIRIIFTVTSHNYVVGGSKTGVVSRKSRTSRHSVKMWMFRCSVDVQMFRCSVDVQMFCLTKKRIYSYYEQFAGSIESGK
jgi:hypothetical protein